MSWCLLCNSNYEGTLCPNTECSADEGAVYSIVKITPRRPSIKIPTPPPQTSPRTPGYTRLTPSPISRKIEPVVFPEPIVVGSLQLEDGLNNYYIVSHSKGDNILLPLRSKELSKINIYNLLTFATFIDNYVLPPGSQITFIRHKGMWIKMTHI
jgi:hypothetical protein